MIEGLKVQFTTKQLCDHIEAVAAHYGEAAETCMRLLETRMAGAKPNVRKYAADCAKSNREVANMWLQVASFLPENETFRFTVHNGHVHGLYWPLMDPATDEEMIAVFERGAHNSQQPNPLVALLGGSGMGAGDFGRDDAPDSTSGNDDDDEGKDN